MKRIVSVLCACLIVCGGVLVYSKADSKHDKLVESFTNREVNYIFERSNYHYTKAMDLFAEIEFMDDPQLIKCREIVYESLKTAVPSPEVIDLMIDFFYIYGSKDKNMRDHLLLISYHFHMSKFYSSLLQQ